MKKDEINTTGVSCITGNTRICLERGGQLRKARTEKIWTFLAFALWIWNSSKAIEEAIRRHFPCALQKFLCSLSLDIHDCKNTGRWFHFQKDCLLVFNGTRCLHQTQFLPTKCETTVTTWKQGWVDKIQLFKKGRETNPHWTVFLFHLITSYHPSCRVYWPIITSNLSQGPSHANFWFLFAQKVVHCKSIRISTMDERQTCHLLQQTTLFGTHQVCKVPNRIDPLCCFGERWKMQKRGKEGTFVEPFSCQVRVCVIKRSSLARVNACSSKTKVMLCISRDFPNCRFSWLWQLNHGDWVVRMVRVESAKARLYTWRWHDLACVCDCEPRPYSPKKAPPCIQCQSGTIATVSRSFSCVR